MIDQALREIASNKLKPPTQGVGLSGIEAPAIVLTPEPKLQVNWNEIGMLPTFQMFAHEMQPKAPDEDSDRHAIDYARSISARIGDEMLLNQYCAWHQKKGYWPNETPFGELING